jgi:plastocyanin
MKKTVIIIPAALVLLLIGGLSAFALSQRRVSEGPTDPAPVQSTILGVETSATEVPTIQVEIGEAAYSPSLVKVKIGTSVVWTNSTATRQTVIDREDKVNGPSSPVLEPKDIYAFTFMKPGTYSYGSQENPAIQGVVEVSE